MIVTWTVFVVSPQSVTTDEKSLLSSSQHFKLINENAFRKTIQSCIPYDDDDDSRLSSQKKKKSKKCLQHVPTDGERKVQRIAIASPPGIASDAFTSALYNSLLTYYYDSDSERMREAMNLVQTSHVPPYGYGKTHGWTKIIRLLGYPVLLHEVADAISWVINNREWKGKSEVGIHGEEDHIRVEMYSQVLKQIIRWHCRLSHVAAHTALFSFDFSSEDMDSVLTRLVKFLVSAPSTMQRNGDIDMEKVRRVGKAMSVEISSLMSAKYADVAKSAFLTHENLEIFKNILSSELENSNNLQKWPCFSFWDVSGDSESSLMEVSRFLAGSLVPDCHNAFTKCTVQKDKCEERGNAYCP